MLRLLTITSKPCASRESARRIRPPGSLLLATVLVALTACGGPAPEAADLVLVGGRVVTLAETGAAEVEGLAIAGDRIVASGTQAEIREWIGADTRVIELDGRSVLPGLTDNHFHSIGGGPGVDLSRARSIDDVLSAIAARARTTTAGEVIVTNSDWHEGQLAEQRLPYRDDLDRATGDHPLVVVRGGHEYILNSAALAHWAIPESVQDMPGGRVGRYDDGRLNGELVDRAKALVTLAPSPTPDTESEAVRLESEHRTMNERGVTSLRYPGGSLPQYETLQRMRGEGRLTVRVEYLFRAPRSGSPEELAEAMTTWPAQGTGDDWVRVGGVKLGVDGGFEGGLMREPYSEPWGEGGTFHGLQTVPREPFLASVSLLNEAGWRVATHAVGDAAIDLVLDVYEAAHEESSIDGRRWVIEHGFIPREDHFPRMRALGLLVTAQDHLYLAAPSLVKYWGEDRAAWTTPLRAYLEESISVSLGTDSPVVPYDPWWVLHHFTTRGTISAGVLDDGQAVSRLEALRAGTSGYAYLAEREDRAGTLEAGRLADLIVTTDDYMTCPDPCLETMTVDFTIVGGRVVWER